ncbi:transmembrane sulfatase [gamma proteobacterium BDW918]|nr:transmembrane sulfatase [gamma proteobacterium BDW918]
MSNYAAPIAFVKSIVNARNVNPVSIHKVNFIISIFLALIYNASLWTRLSQEVGELSVSSLAVYLGFFALVVSISYLVMSLASLAPYPRVFMSAIFTCSSASAYYIAQYGIYIDAEMIVNVFATDTNEMMDLLSYKFIVYIAMLGIAPSIFLFYTCIDFQNTLGGTIKKVLLPMIGLVLAVAMIFPSMQTFASVMRNNKEIRYLVVPGNFVYGSLRVLGDAIANGSNNGAVTTLGDDVALGPAWGVASSKKPKPVLMVLVVGETARAQNFSLSGYHRDTNKNLKDKDIIYYSDVDSCGTSTAVSLPCIFSNLSRQKFSREDAANSENLLDVLKKLPLDVAWVDNNSGCKGVCANIDFSHVVSGGQFCDGDNCYDEALLGALDRPQLTDKVIVLHQSGSHGPAYYKRSPEGSKEYLPECRTNQLQDCTREEIVNAYDNSIAYTDLFVSKLIERLQVLSKDFDTAMIYVSDHGESLGESGMYLHGAPYFMAPEEQTKVPMLMWLGDAYTSRFGIDRDCLKNNASSNYSHDNVFSTVLGMLDIETKEKNRSLDIVGPCMAGNKAMKLSEAGYKHD